MARILRIHHIPRKGPGKGLRHTTYIDLTPYGKVESIELFDPKDLPKIKLKKPSAADIAWAREQLEKAG